MKKHLNNLKPGTVGISAECEDIPSSECFFCTAPSPRAGEEGRADCESAFIAGVIEGVLAMKGQKRKPLCAEHETIFREMIVLFIQDVETFEKLGIEAKVVG